MRRAQSPMKIGRLVIMLSAAAIASGASAASIDDGRNLAVEACSACHKVAPLQKTPAPVAEGTEGAHVQAPTFVQIANRCLTADDLRAKIANPHYPMREQELLVPDLDNLAAYIQSLARKSACVLH